MSEKTIQQIKKIISSFKQVKLAYIFGSQATGKAGPLSDYDFAVYLDERDKAKMFDIRLKLMTQLGLLLKTDEVDVVVLNTADSPDLKFDAIKNGKILLEKEPYKLLIEPQISNEYFDFNFGLFKNHLTKTLYD